MYNKLFTKILDSSIWLEPDTTRIVWLTMLAAMDEDGFVQFASVANLAHRARVPVDAAREAISRLEGPDDESSDPEHDGRRVERVPGGWMILNARKYHELVTRAEKMRLNRDRVQRHREKKRGNALVTSGNAQVMESEAEAQQASDTDTHVCKQRPTSHRTENQTPVVPAPEIRSAHGVPAVPATERDKAVRNLRAVVLVTGPESPIGRRFRSRAHEALKAINRAGRDPLGIVSDIIERSKGKPKAGAWVLRALEDEAGTGKRDP